MLEKLGWCQNEKPCTMSELNHSWPSRVSQEAPLFWGSMAARQDLDAVVWFAWRHGEFRAEPDGPDGALDLDGRFNALVQLPIAAKLFREVEAAKGRFVRWWSTNGILRDLAEQPGLWLDPQVSWQSMLERVSRSSFAPEPPAIKVEKLDEGPLQWSPDQGIFMVSSPEVEVLLGETLGRKSLKLESRVPGFISISLASLGRWALGSAPALLTVVGRCEREGTLWSTGGPGVVVSGRGKAQLERLTGEVRFFWPTKPVVRVVDVNGEPGERVRVVRKGKGWWGLKLDGLESPWFWIE
jgi:hypothetical protein